MGMSLRPAGRASVLRAAIAALACTGAATVLAHPFTERVSVTSIYLLAVVVAAALGGVWGGLAAALLAFLGINFFFTPPRHTFRVERLEDLVALVVFLVVATIVGALLASAVRERARAEQREQETRLLGYLSTKFVSGEPLERVIRDFAAALLDPFELAGCEVRASLDGLDVGGRADRPGATLGSSEVVPLAVGPAAFGTLTATRSTGAARFSIDERLLL